MRYKKTNIKKHRRGRAKVRSHTRKIKVKGGRVNRLEHGLFRGISSPKFKKEYGGAMDFKRDGKLERFTAHIGQQNQVEIPSDDFEVLWHTHNTPDISPPSPDDLKQIIADKKQQSEVVFSPRKTYILTRTKRNRKLKPNSIYKKYNAIWKNLVKTAKSDNQFEKEYLQHIKDDGFNVHIVDKKNVPLKIPIKIME